MSFLTADNFNEHFINISPSLADKKNYINIVFKSKVKSPCNAASQRAK